MNHRNTQKRIFTNQFRLLYKSKQNKIALRTESKIDIVKELTKIYFIPFPNDFMFNQVELLNLAIVLRILFIVS